MEKIKYVNENYIKFSESQAVSVLCKGFLFGLSFYLTKFSFFMSSSN